MVRDLHGTRFHFADLKTQFLAQVMLYDLAAVRCCYLTCCRCSQGACTSAPFPPTHTPSQLRMCAHCIPQVLLYDLAAVRKAPFKALPLKITQPAELESLSIEVCVSV